MKAMLVLLALLLAGGCADRPASAWQPEQAEAAAWWIEDVAHGFVRDPAELQIVGGGPGAAQVARWAAGSRFEGRWVPPRRLDDRRLRWPLLRSALAEQTIESDGAGRLLVAPGAPPARRSALTALVEAEQADRNFIDGLVLALGSPDPGTEQRYRETVLYARSMHDASQGASAPPTRATTH